MSVADICGFGLSFRADEFRIFYSILCVLSFGASFLFAPRYLSHDKHKGRFYAFSLVVLMGTLGVFFAGDFFTLLLFFEIMSMSSYVWVAHEENEKALRAGDTYMAVAVIGGLSLLMGLVILYVSVGTLEISAVAEAISNKGLSGSGRLTAAAILMFVGFGAKAGVFPLHIWLPKAHPVAPAPASALLSGVLTKTGVFGIMMTGLCLFPGGSKSFGLFILASGLVTMALGAVLAIFSTDLKKVLACSSVSQIGFMITGIGAAVMVPENETILTGTVLHMANHTMVKLAVFLTAGVVFENLHELNLNKIKGFGNKKPFLATVFAVAGLSLAGIPGFTGYLSKSILHEAVLETAHFGLSGFAVKIFEWIFLISGGATLCYMTKLFLCLFVKKNDSVEERERFLKIKDYISVPQRAALLVPAVILGFAGILLSVIRFGGLYEWEVLSGGLISVCIGVALYTLTAFTLDKGGVYRNKWPKWLDLEEVVYRPVLLKVLPYTIGFFARILDTVTDKLVVLLRKGVLRDAPLKAERVEGTVFTRFIGHAADVVFAMMRGDDEVEPVIETKLAIKAMETKETNLITMRSLSYGLLLACGGIFVMLCFILILVFIL